MQKINSSICVVVPVYNSEKTLCQLTKELILVLEKFNEYMIVLVDDNSKDNSFDCIKDICKVNEHIVGIKLRKNYGQQNAIMCGLNFSNCDYTVIIDDDMEQDPKDILRLFDEIILGYDVVYGINQNLKSQHRTMGSKMRDMLFCKLTDIPNNKKVSSFRIINGKTVERMKSAKTKFVYISMETLKYTNNIENISIKSSEVSKSNYNIFKLIKLYTNIIIYYSNNRLLNTLARQDECYRVEIILNEGIL